MALRLIDPEPFGTDTGWAEAYGMDAWLSHLDSILIAIRQRRMTADQLDRFASLLADGERDALTRQKRSRRRTT